MSHRDVNHCTSRVVAHGLALLAAILVLIGVAPSAARADGDPASDVLASQALFVPQDAGLSAEQQAQLDGLLAAGRRSGYDLHVAVIASAADLGSVGALWRAPSAYARFLSQELSLAVHGPVLVVMPNGYGYVSSAATAIGDPGAVAGLPSPEAGLGDRTIAAVRHLAQGAGHPLPLLAVQARPSTGASAAGLAWVVFAAGWLAVAVAWAISLHRRPVGWRPTS